MNKTLDIKQKETAKNTEKPKKKGPLKDKELEASGGSIRKSSPPPQAEVKADVRFG